MTTPITQEQVRSLLDNMPISASALSFRHEVEVYCQHYEKMVAAGIGEKALAQWHEYYWRKGSTLRKILCHLDEFFDDETEEYRHASIPHPSPFGIDATDADLPNVLPLAAPIADYIAEHDDYEQILDRSVEVARKRYLGETGAIRFHPEEQGLSRRFQFAAAILIGAGLCAFWGFAGRLLWAEIVGR